MGKCIGKIWAQDPSFTKCYVLYIMHVYDFFFLFYAVVVNGPHISLKWDDMDREEGDFECTSCTSSLAPYSKPLAVIYS